jgi:hypothetical protein
MTTAEREQALLALTMDIKIHAAEAHAAHASSIPCQKRWVRQ